MLMYKPVRRGIVFCRRGTPLAPSLFPHERYEHSQLLRGVTCSWGMLEGAVQLSYIQLSVDLVAPRLGFSFLRVCACAKIDVFEIFCRTRRNAKGEEDKEDASRFYFLCFERIN